MVGSDFMAFEFEIEKEIAVLSEASNGWQKELNLVSWNGREAKYDIRDWSPDHSKMSKGVTLTNQEAECLIEGLREEFQS